MMIVPVPTGGGLPPSLMTKGAQVAMAIGFSVTVAGFIPLFLGMFWPRGEYERLQGSFGAGLMNLGFILLFTGLFVVAGTLLVGTWREIMRPGKP